MICAAHKHRGFTLLELVITVAIVAVLASIALPLAEVSVQRSKEQELRTSLRQIREAIDAYKQAADEGKIARSAQESGYPPSLNALVEGVENIKDPGRSKLYFLRRVPRDPMVADSSMDADATWGKRSYASPADDPQEGEDVFDVYSRSQGTGLNGIPYRQW
ncbi:type II secretion system protein [Noviherbaspirillum massiliense]|uniref:type II secretion system protein n=1 Tax=Noviherbaspirillum massiliense TaxID=1465823 RepID=UPI0003039B80|nr:type II secretion system protein [Noviherbaspirillum massiliense]